MIKVADMGELMTAVEALPLFPLLFPAFPISIETIIVLLLVVSVEAEPGVVS